MASVFGVSEQVGERRKGARHVPVLQLASIETGGRVQLGLVLDLSLSGLSLRAATTGKPGQPITVCLREFVIEGTIAWLDAGKVGVQFYDDLAPEILQSLLSAFDPRMRAPRLNTDLSVKVRLGAEVAQAWLRNISPSGAMLAVDGDPTDRGQVVVTFPQVGPVPGQIRWSDGARIGILFNRALNLKDLGVVVDSGSAWLPREHGPRQT